MAELGLIIYGETGGKYATLWAKADVSGVTAPPPLAWLVGDVNGASKADIVQMFDNSEFGNNHLGMGVWGQEAGGSYANIWYADMGQGAGALAWLIGDVNGDGKDEIVQLFDNTAAGHLGMIIYGQEASGNYSGIWANADMGQGPGALAWLIGDVNGDGKDEIVQLFDNTAAGHLGMIIYGQEASGNYSGIWANADMGQGPGALAWLIGDVNGDGKDEIVQLFDNTAAGHLGMIIYGQEASGNYSGIWANADMGQGPGALAWLIGDVNGDGKDEIVQPFAGIPPLGPIGVQSVSAINIQPTSATLTAIINPDYNNVTFFFQYGLTEQYGDASSEGSITDGSTLVTISETITDLVAGQTYHFRLIANSANNPPGSTDTGDQSFTTPVPTPPKLRTGTMIFDLAPDPSGDTYICTVTTNQPFISTTTHAIIVSVKNSAGETVDLGIVDPVTRKVLAEEATFQANATSTKFANFRANQDWAGDDHTYRTKGLGPFNMNWKEVTGA